ncbi:MULTISPECIES: response regulator [Exiguobacterium]|jgi:CheY-like chemotaxis protein|uniref:Response regulator receiver protein n=1 Tax=Exiguobacterium sibiricum (strain DSM 17290 / CCUG 55495 / CIP 109462 / JCM 13490 / 255-15) TaxID=262543 RepID=B1YKM9_EXIS2|nr:MULTISPECIES: response regulator [Exiguobacterium]ACB60212.1 response regulator receiver protein [Exiguobacterium sibiricum 255-15]MCK2158101.1 response regulator [Exiguobacterium sp. 17-1]MCT4790848.1 response regulator [Exiguobacterium artemiae]MDW2886261.1 response regulator [Exiguobacterium sibiricum]MDX1259727.1 response regulator [Exiguobacterium sp. K1]
MARILLAEDEDVLRMLVLDTLEDEGYTIDEATDGDEAYQKIMSQHYDLVLLDYMMPGMTGIEVIEKVRRHPDKQNLKIMMLTAKSQQSDRERAEEIGANYFFSKPFSPLELIDVVGGILSDHPVD